MTTAENPYAGQGPVLLDVGGDVGALLVTMPPSLEGVEIEIRPHRQGPQHPDPDPGPDPDPDPDPLSQEHLHRPDGNGSSVTHVEVISRPTAAGVVCCAVFPSLLQGRYELYERPSGPVRLLVSITGGQITQQSWPP